MKHLFLILVSLILFVNTIGNIGEGPTRSKKSIIERQCWTTVGSGTLHCAPASQKHRPVRVRQ